MKSYLIIVFVFITFNLFAQNNESIVAQVGNDKITAREFKLRLELAPYIPQDNGIPKDSIKYDLLYSLIAEKIWALKAQNEGIENTQQFDFFFNPVEDLFVRDALFKQEIETKVNITATDLEKGIYKSQFTQAIRFISSSDSIGIFSFHNQLSKVQNVDSLISLFPSINDTLINVKFGDLELEASEDTVYSLKKGNFSTPQKVPGGWIIYYCTDNIYTPVNIGDQQTVEGIRKNIRSRKLEIVFNEYRNNLLMGTNIRINSASLSVLSNSIWQTLKHKSPIKQKEKISYELDENDFVNILNSFSSDELRLNLFNIREKNVSLFHLFSRVAYLGFSVPYLDSNIVYSKLAATAYRFVEEQILTEEGYKKGYNLLPVVQSDLKVWKQKYLAQIYLSNTLNSIQISEDELQKYYTEIFQNYSNQVFVKLIIVTLNNLDAVSTLLDQMNSGVSFSELAKSFGKTDSLVNEDGITELLPIALLNDLRDYVSGMNKGEVFGPVKRNNGYSIIQMVEREERPNNNFPPFDQVKNELRTNLRYKKLKENLNDLTAKTSLQLNVKIYNNVVDKIITPQVPMFVHRFMGFGGRMAGVPLTTPFSGWINSEIKQKLLP